MWIKKTQQEKAISSRAAKKSIKGSLILFCLIFIPIFAFIRPRSTIGIGGKVFVTVDEAIHRLWYLVPLVLAAGYLEYRSGIKKKFFFCPKCENTSEENTKVCSVCGSELGLLEDYKWEEMPNDHGTTNLEARRANKTNQVSK